MTDCMVARLALARIFSARASSTSTMARGIAAPRWRASCA